MPFWLSGGINMETKVIEIQNELRQFCGTEQYHKLTLGSLKGTDGVAYLCERVSCYWLIDIIASVQPMLKRKGGDEFQVWTLKVNLKDHTAVVRCSDGNENELYVQEIGYTDFPLEEIVLFCTNDVVMLPGES